MCVTQNLMLLLLLLLLPRKNLKWRYVVLCSWRWLLKKQAFLKTSVDLDIEPIRRIREKITKLLSDPFAGATIHNKHMLRTKSFFWAQSSPNDGIAASVSKLSWLSKTTSWNIWNDKFGQVRAIILSVWGGDVFCVSHDVLMNDHNTKYVFCIVSGLWMLIV